MNQIIDYSNYIAAAYLFTATVIVIFSYLSLRKYSSLKAKFKNGGKNEKS